jgi:hypothetical protein
MPGFDDIFEGFDDIVDENANSSDEWGDAGGMWDTGEKENIWRTETPRQPGDVWDCHGGCPDCEDECAEAPETVTPRPGDPISENISGPLSSGPDDHVSSGPEDKSEYDEMEEYDNLLDEEGDSADDSDDSDGGSFGDILGDW